MPPTVFSDEVAVVVDGVSTGAFLAPAFLAHGMRCVHVTTPGALAGPLGATHSPGAYLDDISYGGDLDALVRLLAPYRVTHVLAGVESGVELASDLAAALDVVTRNDEKFGHARRDKAAMLDRLSGAGLEVRDHLTARTEAEAVAWSETRDEWPVVVKPTGSAGTDGVRVCFDATEVASAAAAVLGTPNIFGGTNDVVLLEAFLAGQEYMVNAVSVDGRHRVTEVWHTAKRLHGGAMIYDFHEIIPPSSEISQRISAYVREVLDALGVRWGPSHTEVIVSGDGVQVVETAARTHGSIDPSATVRVYGSNQVLDTVRALTNPDAFWTSPPAGRDDDVSCSVLSFICPRDGVVVAQPDWDRVRSLRTFHAMRVRWSPTQERVRRTTDMFTSAGGVYLVGDRADMRHDRELIRRWEAEDFYDGVVVAEA
ncbi:ATP-grasp domain-containing protein [Lentzea sp. NPDC003310]|uniref:ATP-grasp domain-containing protein n=1 Tax=Lentzea sp. NPDC003310 TaxID=3154447 RepID=UPI0033B19181